MTCSCLLVGAFFLCCLKKFKSQAFATFVTEFPKDDRFRVYKIWSKLKTTSAFDTICDSHSEMSKSIMKFSLCFNGAQVLISSVLGPRHLVVDLSDARVARRQWVSSWRK